MTARETVGSQVLMFPVCVISPHGLHEEAAVVEDTLLRWNQSNAHSKSAYMLAVPPEESQMEEWDLMVVLVRSDMEIDSSVAYAIELYAETDQNMIFCVKAMDSNHQTVDEMLMRNMDKAFLPFGDEWALENLFGEYAEEVGQQFIDTARARLN